MNNINKKGLEQIILGLLMLLILIISLFAKENIIIKYVLVIPFIIESIIIFIKGFKKISINTIVSISIISSIIYSIYLDINYKESCNIFLFIISFVIFVLKLKELVESLVINKIENESNFLRNKKHIRIKVKTNDTFKEVFYDEVKDKDIVICSSEEEAYFDGKVIKGNTHFNESYITGESNPVEKSVNSKILKGSKNYENEIEYVVEVTNNNKNKQEEKIFDKDIDKISKKYLLLIIIFEVLNVIISIILKDSLIQILNKCIVTLIIPTICGIIIYNYPEIKEIKRYLKKGILIKEKNIFEEINKINTVVFDKTGILTNGYLGINKISNHSDMKTSDLLDILGSIEKHSTHALGIGITKYLKKEGITTKYDFITEDLNSFDVKAKDDKNIYYACTSSLLKKLDIINSYEKEEEAMKIEGNYVIYLVKNNKVLALFALKDMIKNESKRLIKSLKEKNIDIIVLSGDNEVVTKKITDELGIEKVYSGLNCNEKKKIIDDLKKNKKHVLMMGDGDNDSLALKSSNISVTIKDSTYLAKEKSDIIIKSNSITKILEIMDKGKRVLNKIRENIIISILLFTLLEILNIINFSVICICILIIIICIISYTLIIINTIRQ